MVPCTLAISTPDRQRALDQTGLGFIPCRVACSQREECQKYSSPLDNVYVCVRVTDAQQNGEAVQERILPLHHVALNTEH
jgi:hypothetical protein